MLSTITDRKYIGFISNRLRNFRHRGNGLSCFTHDCEKSTSKKRRAYFLEGQKSGGMMMKCHHCGECTSFSHFLKSFDPSMYTEYRMECFRENKEVHSPVDEPPKPKVEPKKVRDMDGLISYASLRDSHPAVQYLFRRSLPREKIDTLYIAPKFFQWAKQYEESFIKRTDEHPRLVIPYFDKDGSIIGFTCRAYGKQEPKYIQLRLDKDKEFLYGLDKVDVTKRIIVVEGHIDSMFLDNAIAVGNANYGASFLKTHKDNVVIVPDNDFRRNPEVCKQLKRAIDNGFAVCLLPSKWPKDINDGVKDGIPPKEIMDYIQNHTKRGLSALLEFTLEKRC